MCYSLNEPIIQNANFVCLRYVKNGSRRSFPFPTAIIQSFHFGRGHTLREADLVLLGSWRTAVGFSWLTPWRPAKRWVLEVLDVWLLVRRTARPPVLVLGIPLLWVPHGFYGGALGFPAFRRGSPSPLRGATASIAPRVNCENQPLTYNIKKQNLSISHNFHL